jgi:hypothetical protein
MGHHFSSKFNSNFEKFTASVINLTSKYLTCNKLNFDVKVCKMFFDFMKSKFVLKLAGLHIWKAYEKKLGYSNSRIYIKMPYSKFSKFFAEALKTCFNNEVLEFCKRF